MGQTALVTGASGGIGRALALEFARAGYDLVLVARRGPALEELARILSAPDGGARTQSASRREPGHAAAVLSLPIDLAQPGSAREVWERLNAAGREVEVVVNNAGFAMQGRFADLPLGQQLEMIQLNVTTLTELTRLCLPAMVQRNRGGVLNVASTAAFQPGPLMAVYYATKAYVLSFTEGIAEEVAGTGVKVSCLCPGATETGFAERARVQETPLFRGSVMRADDVARAGYEGWTRGEVVIIPGAANRRGTWVVRVAPRAMVRRLVKRLNSAAKDVR